MYVWSVNGREALRGEHRQFHVPPAEPPYTVKVEVLDNEGQKAQIAWNVTVKTPLQIPLLTDAQPQDATGSAKTGEPLNSSLNAERFATAPQLSDAEVKAWLETYRQAWEGKKVDVLVQLGEISAQDAARLKRVLDEYRNFRVALTDVILRHEGNRATVRFTRVDTVDGQILSHPPLDLTIEKETDGNLRRK